MASLARECRFQRNAETPSTLNASPIARNSETKIRFYKIRWTVNIAISPNVRYERHIHWWSNMRIFELEERELLEELRSEEHTSELQSLMRISYAVFCLKKKKHKK